MERHLILESYITRNWKQNNHTVIIIENVQKIQGQERLRDIWFSNIQCTVVTEKIKGQLILIRFNVW
mgnify:CR=1 FL=1